MKKITEPAIEKFATELLENPSDQYSYALSCFSDLSRIDDEKTSSAAIIKHVIDITRGDE